MIVKIISLFLIAMVALALFGRLRMPLRRGPKGDAGRCRSCGRPLAGKGRCTCGKGAA